MADPVRMYFSFRSPYSWLGFTRLRRVARDWDFAIDYVPVFPPDPSRVASTSSEVRIRYTREDVERFAAAYGLEVRWPEARDTDWARPHACFLHAQERGRGEDFIAAAYQARFGQGRDLGRADVLGAIAGALGLDPEALVAAGDSDELRARVLERMAAGFREGEFFGVPTWVYEGRHFWGNDRLEWLLREIAVRRGRPVPDLAADPLASPVGIVGDGDG